MVEFSTSVYVEKRKMFLGYVDNCLRLLFVVVLAEVLQRVLLILWELKHYGGTYLPEHREWKIIQRAFTFKMSALYLVLTLIAVSAVRLSFSGRVPLPPVCWLAFIPLHWGITLSQFSHSTLSYASWIRESHGLDYGAGMASSYFHGFLKQSLPSRNDTKGLRSRMTAYEDANNVTFGNYRLLILIPDEMFVNGTIDSQILGKAKHLEPVQVNRAGVTRSFKHDVYRLNKRVNGTHYYFALEGATPMLTFFEAMHFNLSATWQMHEMKREIWLKFSKHLKMLIESWPETRNEIELIMYNSHNDKGDQIDVGELVAQRIRT